MLLTFVFSLLDLISSFAQPTAGVSTQLHNEWHASSGEITINGGGSTRWGDLATYFPVPKPEKKSKEEKEKYEKDKKANASPTRTLSAQRNAHMVPAPKLLTTAINRDAIKSKSNSPYASKATLDTKKTDEKVGGAYESKPKPDAAKGTSSSTTFPAFQPTVPAKEGDCFCYSKGAFNKIESVKPAPTTSESKEYTFTVPAPKTAPAPSNHFVLTARPL